MAYLFPIGFAAALDVTLGLDETVFSLGGDGDLGLLRDDDEVLDPADLETTGLTLAPVFAWGFAVAITG